MPETSIIVLNYNGLDRIKKCFSSILKQEYRNFEIIFVDNGSSPNEYRLIKKFIMNLNNNNHKIIFVELDKNHGYSIGKNIGAKNASGKYLFFLDNDIALKKNTLKLLLDYYKKKPSCGTICPVIIDGITNEACFIGRRLTYIGTECGLDFSTYKEVKDNESKKIGHPTGGAFLIKKDIWEKLGGFDESNFWSLDDFDLGARSWIYGYANYCVIPAQATHYGQRWYNLSNKIWATRYYNFNRGVLIMMLKNFQKKTLLISLPAFFAYSFFKSIKNSIARKNAKIITKYFTSIFSLLNIKTIQHIQKQRDIIQRNRKVSDSVFLQLK